MISVNRLNCPKRPITMVRPFQLRHYYAVWRKASVDAYGEDPWSDDEHKLGDEESDVSDEEKHDG